MTTDNIGGVWTYSIELARALMESGIEVFLAVIGDSLSDSQVNDLQDIPHLNFIAKQEWMESPWEEVQSTREWLWFLKQRVNPDVLHLNSYTLASHTWDIPVVVTFHSCVLSWWEAVKNEKVPSEWKLYIENITRGIRAADIVVAPSNEMLKTAERIYGPLQRTSLIYNGRDHRLFYPGKKEKIIFSMGRLWDEAKNIQLLLEAAPLIDYPIYIAGKYNDNDFKNKPSNVYLLGQLSQKQVAYELSRAAVYMLPARYEPFGYTFLEAALSGCALIGGDIGTLNEIWGRSMLYAGTDSAFDLAQTVNVLMKDEELLSMMQQKAFTHAVEHYSTHEMADSYISAYENIVESRVESAKIKIS